MTGGNSSASAPRLERIWRRGLASGLAGGTRMRLPARGFPLGEIMSYVGGWAERLERGSQCLRYRQKWPAPLDHSTAISTYLWPTTEFKEPIVPRHSGPSLDYWLGVHTMHNVCLVFLIFEPNVFMSAITKWFVS